MGNITVNDSAIKKLSKLVPVYVIVLVTGVQFFVQSLYDSGGSIQAIYATIVIIVVSFVAIIIFEIVIEGRKKKIELLLVFINSGLWIIALNSVYFEWGEILKIWFSFILALYTGFIAIIPSKTWENLP